MTIESQDIGKIEAEIKERWMGTEITAKISRSQLRDPVYVEMATRGVVEVRTGGQEDVAMLPLSQLVEMEKVQFQCLLYVQAIIASKHLDVPRSLLGDVAFVVDLTSHDRERFLDEFAEALIQSIQRGDHRPAAFLFSAFQQAAMKSSSGNPMFNGEFGEGVEAALRRHIATT